MSDAAGFFCDAWTRRVHKCESQCDGCFRKQYEARLVRAEKLLREFITTCELHHITSDKFWDLWSDAEAGRVYFRELGVVPVSSSLRDVAEKCAEICDALGSINHRAAAEIRTYASTLPASAVLERTASGKGPEETCPRCYGEGPSADCELCKGSGVVKRTAPRRNDEV